MHVKALKNQWLIKYKVSSKEVKLLICKDLYPPERLHLEIEREKPTGMTQKNNCPRFVEGATHVSRSASG